MENRVTVSICGEDYTLVAEEAPSYMQKVGSYVDAKLSELLASAKVGRTDAAVLAAVNIADELFKEREASETLRTQVKEYIDDASRARNEVSELKRELFKLRNQGGHGGHGSQGGRNDQGSRSAQGNQSSQSSAAPRAEQLSLNTPDSRVEPSARSDQGSQSKK